MPDISINRCEATISNTPGTAGGFTAAAALSGKRLPSAAHNGRTFTLLVEEGTSSEVATGCVWNNGTQTWSRGTLEESCIGGVVSTSTRVSFTSAAVVRATISAAGLRAMTATAGPSSQLIVGLGDSLTAQGVVLTPSAPGYTIITGLNWGCALLKQAVWMPVGLTSAYSSGAADIVNYCLAVSGVTSATVLSTQVPAAVSLKAGWWSLLIGTNDLTLLAGDSVATICGRLQQIVEAGFAVGVRVALWTIPPRSDAAWTALNSNITGAGSTIAAQKLKHMAVNAWIRRYAQETPGVVLIDPYNDLVDVASSAGDWLSAYSSDGTHWNAAGAFIAGRVFARAMAPFIKEVASGSIGQNDVFNATNNPGGNMLPVAAFTMQGTGGAISGTGISGNVPTGWNQDLEFGTLTPGTAVLATQARADVLSGGREVQVTLAGSAPGDFTLRFYQAAASIPANTTFFSEVEVECVSVTAGGFRGVELLSFNQSGTPPMNPAAFAAATGVLPVGTSFTAVFRTPLARSSGAINHLLMTRINGSANSAGVLRLRRPAIRAIDAGALGLLLGA